MNEKQKEILRITQEECAEVIQAISKIFRFGIDEVYDGVSNQQRLQAELGDLQCMISLLKESGLVDDYGVHKEEMNKRNRLGKWSNIFDNEFVN